jgi:hypothetical protein
MQARITRTPEAVASANLGTEHESRVVFLLHDEPSACRRIAAPRRSSGRPLGIASRIVRFDVGRMVIRPTSSTAAVFESFDEGSESTAEGIAC